jgi:hypothetical protein
MAEVATQAVPSPRAAGSFTSVGLGECRVHDRAVRFCLR